VWQLSNGLSREARPQALGLSEGSNRQRCIRLILVRATAVHIFQSVKHLLHFVNFRVVCLRPDSAFASVVVFPCLRSDDLEALYCTPDGAQTRLVLELVMQVEVLSP